MCPHFNPAQIIVAAQLLMTRQHLKPSVHPHPCHPTPHSDAAQVRPYQYLDPLPALLKVGSTVSLRMCPHSDAAQVMPHYE